MKFFGKYFIIILNLLAFCIALCDGFILRNSNIGFPICTFFGICFANMLGVIYLVYDTIKNRPENIFIRFILIWFTAWSLTFVGGVAGFIAGCVFL